MQQDEESLLVEQTNSHEEKEDDEYARLNSIYQSSSNAHLRPYGSLASIGNRNGNNSTVNTVHNFSQTHHNILHSSFRSFGTTIDDTNSIVSTIVTHHNNINNNINSNNTPTLRFVPTLLRDNVRLVTLNSNDPNAELGTLYMNQESFYNPKVQPEYALSISSTIYQQMLDEVSDAHTIPLRMYFCCHGGDLAHSGNSHDDHVDIEVAIGLLVTVFFMIMVFTIFLPWPVNDVFSPY